GSSGPPVRRRRIAFGTLMSGFLVKALIGTAAFAAVGTGAAVGSDGAVPGDALYGLDRALERVGINHGGASERIEEAMVLVDRGTHGRALETIQEAVEDLAGDPGDAGAVAALQNAADHIATIRSTGATGYGDTQAFRDQVAGFLNAIAADMEDGKVDGAMVAENARQFSATARSFAESRGAAPDEAGPPGPGTSSGPPDPGPGNKPDEPPGQADRDDRRP
ncbi:MAG: hypothetical protein KJO17_11310, partial [Acidimicrobiia bacterium]|nr:hypothetical protein [Acidimicrobiia bacterium]